MATKKAAKKSPAKQTQPSIAEQVATEVAKQIPKVDTGIAVAMPNTVEQKMQAICDLAEAVSQLAKAVASTNINVRIEGCNLQNHKTGIYVG